MRILSIFFALLLLVTVGFAQERFVKPVDEADKDASFAAFRTKLISAAERKDDKYILSIVDPKIMNGFGGKDGIANFKKEWNLERKDSAFWTEFLPVIKNGGTFDKESMNRFTAPYTFSTWPEDLDSFEYLAIFGSDVNMRKTSGKDGEIVGKLSYNVVKVEDGFDEKGNRREWQKVRTLGGLSGYVHSDLVRSPIAYRAGFEKKRGRWVMTFFLSGD